jgi:RNA polymerase sigma-70 factor (ECF subfamily)
MPLGMTQPETTSWRLIEGAARGGVREKAEFARRYEPSARAYFAARWRGSPLMAEIDDAIQELFVECYRKDGVLAKADPERSGGFRALFFGVVRNVALRCEQKLARDAGKQPDTSVKWERMPDPGASLSTVFDRAWARSVMRDAAAEHAARARREGAAAWRRYEILRLRFQEDMPIRDIAKLWNADAADVHHDYATARREFEAVLREVVAQRCSGTPEHAEQALKELLDAIG